MAWKRARTALNTSSEALSGVPPAKGGSSAYWIPHFNPDFEGNEPSSVIGFCARVQASRGLLISTPEYAHGVPGVLKNALYWLVGTPYLVGKPVALLNASPRATHAYASLTETISVMAARIIAEASITVPLLGKSLDEPGIISHPEISATLGAALTASAHAIEMGRAESAGT